MAKSYGTVLDSYYNVLNFARIYVCSCKLDAITMHQSMSNYDREIQISKLFLFSPYFKLNFWLVQNQLDQLIFFFLFKEDDDPCDIIDLYKIQFLRFTRLWVFSSVTIKSSIIYAGKNLPPPLHQGEDILPASIMQPWMNNITFIECSTSIKIGFTTSLRFNISSSGRYNVYG